MLLDISPIIEDIFKQETDIGAEGFNIPQQVGTRVLLNIGSNKGWLRYSYRTAPRTLHIWIGAIRVPIGEGFGIENRLDEVLGAGAGVGAEGRWGSRCIEVMRALDISVEIEAVSVTDPAEDWVRVLMSNVTIHKVIVCNGWDVVEAQRAGKRFDQSGGYHLDMVQMFRRSSQRSLGIHSVRIDRLERAEVVAGHRGIDWHRGSDPVGMIRKLVGTEVLVNGIMLSEGIEYSDIVVGERGIVLEDGAEDWAEDGGPSPTRDIETVPLLHSLGSWVNVNWCHGITIGSPTHPITIRSPEKDIIIKQRKVIIGDGEYETRPQHYDVWLKTPSDTLVSLASSSPDTQIKLRSSNILNTS